MTTYVWRPSRREFIKQAAGVVFVSGSFALLLQACGGGASSTASKTGAAGGAQGAGSPNASLKPSVTPVKGGTFTFGTLGDVTFGSLDVPLTTGTTDFMITKGMTEPYLNQANLQQLQDGQFIPDLAQSWEVTSDGLHYTFKLRPDVKFHDGAPLNADAVKWNFDRIADKKRNPNGLSYSYLGVGLSYDGCEKVDDLTFRINLTKPNPLLTTRFHRFHFTPQSPAAVEKFGDQYYKNPVMTGPFKFKEWVEHDHVTLVRNPDYTWGPAQIFPNTGAAYLDAVVFRIILDVTTRVAALQSGQLDAATGLNPQDVSRLKGDSNLVVFLRDQMGQSTQLNCNVEKPPTNDIAVRKAMNFAIDRDGLTKTVFFGVYPPATHLFTPDMWSYDASLASLYKYDPKQAESILEQAGWKMGSNGLRQKDGQDLKLLWLIDPSDQQVAQFVQAQFQKVGMGVDLKALAGAGLNEATLRGEHNITGHGHWINEDPDVVRNWLHSSLIDVRQNFVRLRDKNVDDLLDKGATMPGDVHTPEREAVYKEIQKIVMENAYIVPLYYERTIAARSVKANMDNIGYDPFGTYYDFQDVFLMKG